MRKSKRARLRALLILTLLAACACGGLAYHGWSANAAAGAAADQLRGLKPTEEAGARMDFGSLRAENPDIIGWLTVDGTAIDYPVAQGGDNDYYLRHDARKRPNKNGTLFLDCRVPADVSEFNNVVYGHHMRSGRMFRDLTKFKDRQFFGSHQTGRLYTPGRSYRLAIFAVALTGHRSAYYRYAFLSPAEKEEHLGMVRQTALFYRDIGVTQRDTILTLSTCSYEFLNARTVVLARLTEE